MFSAQLWQLTNQELINKDYDLHGSLYGKRWNLPVEGDVGYIELVTSSDFVLGVWNDSATAGTNVSIEMKKEPISEGQKWTKGKESVNGWFILTNPNSGKILQFNIDSQWKQQATIEGNCFIPIVTIININSIKIISKIWHNIPPHGR